MNNLINSLSFSCSMGNLHPSDFSSLSSQPKKLIPEPCALENRSSSKIPSSSSSSSPPLSQVRQVNAKLTLISDSPLFEVMNYASGIDFAHLLCASTHFARKGKQLSFEGATIFNIQRVRNQLVGLSNCSFQTLSERVKTDVGCYRRLCGDHFIEISNPFQVFLNFQEYMVVNHLDCERSIRMEHYTILPHIENGKPYPYLVIGLKISPEQRLQLNALLTALADSSLKFRINSPNPEDNASRSIVSLMRFCDSTQIMRALLNKLPTHKCLTPYAPSSPEDVSKAKSLYEWTGNPWKYPMDRELSFVINALSHVMHHFSDIHNNPLISQEYSDYYDLSEKFANDEKYNFLKTYLRSTACEKDLENAREKIDVLSEYTSGPQPSRCEMFKELYLRVELLRASSIAFQSQREENVILEEVRANAMNSEEFQIFMKEIENRPV